MVVVALGGGSLLANRGSGTPASTHTASGRGTSGTTASGSREGPGTASVVANVDGREALVYRSPRQSRPWRRYANPTAQGTPLVFLVRARAGGWLRVLLPSRPNGSAGWLRDRGLTLRADRWAVVVNLRSRRLLVRYGGHSVLSAPVGAGRAATPTPPGLYYITALLRQPHPRGLYGPWAFALSAFSPVLTHFGAGDGQVGLHGTNEPRRIGRAVSHGCIRVRNQVIERLARLLPLGTPVRILGARTERAEARSRQFT